MNNFKLIKESKKTKARLGSLKTKHGVIETPFFMPIATKAAIKSLTADDMLNLESQILLSNTYHLYLRPGMKLLQSVKGLHKFMNWPGPILTDSGGFQVFSLDADLNRKGINRDNKVKVGRKITDKGVEFRSYLDGSKHMFTPEKVIKIQSIIGSDIMMVLDECVGNPSTRSAASKAVNRTTKWAGECIKAKNKFKLNNLLFGIVQGSLYKDLRLKSVAELIKLEFDGYAIGGLAVGEKPVDMYKVLDYTASALPKDKPRYLMGVGYPDNIIEAVKRGVDMFDCVIPTREARHGRLYIYNNDSIKGKFYKPINILNAKFSNDFKVINKDSKIKELREYTFAYLHHLFKTQEPLAIRLATLNNIEFYLTLMKRIRKNIKENTL
ncbi:tRNA guanosine(34) transglycosylase Tgt [Patescibacteria group bacterium]|nr:tRNA guanosine(34) transglycosylase Tgt [Patescibacteria group bacterium]